MNDFIFIAQAFANDGSTTSSGFMSFLPLILIFFVFYFLLIRPQQKKMKQHQEFLKNIKKNDKVVTSSGILGKVSLINKNENIVELEIANGIKINIYKQHVNPIEQNPKETTIKNKLLSKKEQKKNKTS